MKTSALALVATVFLALPAFAQSPAPDAAPAAAAPPAAATPGDAQPAKGGKAKPKEIMMGCRSDAKAQGLKGPAMRKAVDDCVVKQRPDLAGRVQCREDGRAKGLKKDELKAFVKDCVKGKG